jgi:hypothetical protein
MRARARVIEYGQVQQQPSTLTKEEPRVFVLCILCTVCV